MLKALVRKHLLEYMVNEAVPMEHFKDRFKDVVKNVVALHMPDTAYLPNVPKEAQDSWIATQIRDRVTAKVKAIETKDYPTDRGSCVLVPLGLLKVQPIHGSLVNVLVTAERKENNVTGMAYYVTIYQNRIPTIVLADHHLPANSSVGNQFHAHLVNTEKSGYTVDRNKSFIDKSFMDHIVIKMSEFKPIPVV